MPDYTTHLTAVDVTAPPTPIYAYEFVSVGGTSNLTGFFVDGAGRQCSPLVTVVITDGQTFFDATGVVSTNPFPIPSQARGFEGALDADVFVGKMVNDIGILPAEAPQAGYPAIPSGSYIKLGRTS